MTKTNDLEVDVQYALESGNTIEGDSEEPPSSKQICQWARTAYAISGSGESNAEVTIRIVSEAEIQNLNSQYRGKDKPTNVLSFPVENEFAEVAACMDLLLGDVVVCHEVVVAEAQQQEKSVHDHYAHMITHGVLHLCGYDHQNDRDAEHMEAVETKILAQLDIANPYEPDVDPV